MGSVKRTDQVEGWLASRVESFRCAFSGLSYVLRTQKNAQIHAAAAFLVVILGSMLQIAYIEWCFLVFAIVSVWVAETLNTSLETLVDALVPDVNPLAETTKDTAAAAVLIATLGAIFLGLIVFVPRIFLLITSLTKGI